MFSEHNNYHEGKDSFDPEGKLSYQSLTQELKSPTNMVFVKEYTAMLGRKFLGGKGAEDFIHVVRDSDLPDKTTEVPTHIELKIHISLLEEEPTHETRALGWNIAKHILCSYGVGSFKVIRKELKMSSNSAQQGKDVTIYAGYSKHLDVADWQHLLEEITRKFVINEVRPGYPQQSTAEKPEQIVKGSKYFSYRYFDEVHQKSIPWPNPDPFVVVDLNHINQPFDPLGYSSAQTETLVV